MSDVAMRVKAVAACVLCVAAAQMAAQQAVTLPAWKAAGEREAQRFAFATDGPTGPGWTRPDLIARAYVDEQLPTLFRRTLRLDEEVPERCRLSWIFTGPHGGITVELTGNKIKLTQRMYDSMGLYQAGSYPEKVVQEQERAYTGSARRLSVVVDAHLAVTVLVNGEPMLWQSLTIDLTRQQMMFGGPRSEHMVLAGALLAEPVEDVDVRVHASQVHQRVLGFGGSPSVPAYARLSERGKQMYWELLRHYNLLVDREYPMGTELKQDLSNVEALTDATPHYYGDNFPNGEVSDFAYSRKTRELGGSVLYEMWALPAWATEAYTPQGAAILDAWGKQVKTAAKPDVYARTVVEFCRRAKEKSGAAPEIVGIQNEVEQAPEIYAAMTTALRKALDAAGFASTKIQMADAPYAWMALHRVEDLKKFPEAWRETDYTAAHQYDVQEFLANPDAYDMRLRALREAGGGKPFLATEICLNDPKFQEASYRLALQVAQLYQKDLTEADAEMLLYCWLILDVEQPNFAASRSLLVADRTRGDVPVASSFQLRALGAFSRHALAGMRRVDSTSSNPDLLTVAFSDGKRNSMVAVNRSTSALRLHTAWKGVRWTRVERTSFYSENAEGSVPADIVVQPGEIVTLADFEGAK